MSIRQLLTELSHETPFFTSNFRDISKLYMVNTTRKHVKCIFRARFHILYIGFDHPGRTQPEVSGNLSKTCQKRRVFRLDHIETAVFMERRICNSILSTVPRRLSHVLAHGFHTKFRDGSFSRVAKTLERVFTSPAAAPGAEPRWIGVI